MDTGINLCMTLKTSRLKIAIMKLKSKISQKILRLNYSLKIREALKFNSKILTIAHTWKLECH